MEECRKREKNQAHERVELEKLKGIAGKMRYHLQFKQFYTQAEPRK